MQMTFRASGSGGGSVPVPLPSYMREEDGSIMKDEFNVPMLEG